MEEKNYIGYDYMEVTVKRGKENIYIDNYPNFGWELEDTGLSFTEFDSYTLKFRRGRKIQNKAELTRLQRQFESGMKEAARLERSKTLNASIIAYVIGSVGMGFAAGAVLFQVLAGLLALTIIFGVLTLAAWGMGYLSYRLMLKKRTEAVTPLIEKQYDEIYEICEEAAKLI